jgi:hypothetical protein
MNANSSDRSSQDTTTPALTEREAFEAPALQFVGLEPLSDFDYAGFARAAIAQESLKHCRVTEIKLTEDQRSMLTSTAKEIPGAALAPVVAPVADERIAELWSEACAQYKPGMNTSPVHIFVRLLSQHPAVAPSASPAQGDEALRQAMEALEYHTEQTRPIERTAAAIAAIRARLEGTK